MRLVLLIVPEVAAVEVETDSVELSCAVELTHSGGNRWLVTSVSCHNPSTHVQLAQFSTLKLSFGHNKTNGGIGSMVGKVRVLVTTPPTLEAN